MVADPRGDGTDGTGVEWGSGGRLPGRRVGALGAGREVCCRRIVGGQLAVRVLESEVVEGGEDQVGSGLGLWGVEEDVDERVIGAGLRAQAGVQRMAKGVLG